MAALAADLGVGRTVDTFVGERYVTPTATAVKRILAEASEGDDQPSACELIEALIAEHGWSAVRREMLELLRTYERPEDWHTAAQVLWGAVLDGREIDANEAIAHLYLRLPRDGDVASSDDRDNLAWSIVCKLKHKAYLSEYDPLQDEEVQHTLHRLRSKSPE